MNRTITALAQLPTSLTIFFCVALVGLVGWLDFATGADFEVTAFYIIPIVWASWAVGRRSGLLIAVISVGFATAVDIMTGRAYGHPAIAYWNAVMLLVVFVVAVFAITAATSAFESLAKAQDELRNANEGLEQTVQRRTAALRAEVVERRRLEQEKLKAERLLERQEKLATLGTLTAGIAHEIRNPLTSLKARLYTLEKQIHGIPAARKDTDIINAEILRLERIVSDALSFARPADPKLEPRAADALLHEIQSLMATSLESRAVQLVVEASSGLLIRADSGHLKQVLINLVRNAADAIEGTGTITLRTRATRAALGGHETDVVMLEVSDTGKGIPPEIEKRLFDPFFSTKETGTGLGLPIALSMIQKHGGKIEYQTQPGHGTTFSVVLLREINDTDASAKRDTESKS